MLQSASKAYIRHPECDAGRINRDYAYDQMIGALNGMQSVLNGGHAGDIPHGNIGDLMEALNDFDVILCAFV